MNKTIFIFFVLLSANLFAKSIDYSFQGEIVENKTTDTQIKRYTQRIFYEDNFIKDKYENIFEAEYIGKEIGDSLSIENIGEYNFNDIFNCWYGIDYQNIEPLNVYKQLNYKLGAGIVVYQYDTLTSKRKIKVSYGLLLRDNRLHNSFRLKDNYSYIMLKYFALGYNARIDYICRFTKNYPELKILFNPYIKVFNFEPGLVFKYHDVGNFKNNYLMFNIKVNI